MVAKSYTRGHEIEYQDEWVYSDTIYSDTRELASNERPCVRCGRMPTKEGHDACLGTLPGVKHACCGHGVEEGYKI